MRDVACECGREIPIPMLWSAVDRGACLICDYCDSITEIADLLILPATAAAVVMFQQLQQAGWVSSDSVANALGEYADRQRIGGLLSGLARAGLIERSSVDHARQHVVGDPSSARPSFVPGPAFVWRRAATPTASD